MFSIMIWPQPISNSWWQANGEGTADDDDEDDVTMVVPVESENSGTAEMAHLKAVDPSSILGVSETQPSNIVHHYYSEMNFMMRLASHSGLKLLRDSNPTRYAEIGFIIIHPNLILGNFVLKSSSLGVPWGYPSMREVIKVNRESVSKD